ncbi:hypothetical protein [Actinomadura atramentaria]|uniref:hypothetical protein n=1 Tax=Actinomadura atramentaria TaxID=1990 RepID=UPI00037998CF|nr:hypothetical protein [Actinomadura atramentaria]
MNVEGLLVVALAVLCVCAGMSWERARHARFDAPPFRRRAAELGAAAFRDRGNALLIVAGAALVVLTVAWPH